MSIPEKILTEKLVGFVKEDVGQGDVTTEYIVPEGLIAKARVIAKEEGIMAGIEDVQTLLKEFGIEVKPLLKDGSKVKPGALIMELEGDARTILSVERSILNILSRMSGIATMTRSLIEKVRATGYKVKIACTRKTAPGLLYFDKKAVMIGGGDTHRLHLDDMVLIKDNHVRIAGSLEEAVRRAKEEASFSKKIEVEVSTPEDAIKAAKLGVDIIMLDNMGPSQVKESLRKLRKEGVREKVLVEVSGRISEENILDYAKLGPDIISLGAITESPKSLDMSLEIVSFRRA